ncbi:hypothetical protein [Salininema proteolyticum]|uniref:Uncharacterized protein n=1 Tax=Salininema proteolyticum TaxID=1607685 RepID=A0ABV8U2Q3_9ACTN
MSVTNCFEIEQFRHVFYETALQQIRIDHAELKPPTRFPHGNHLVHRAVFRDALSHFESGQGFG